MEWSNALVMKFLKVYRSESAIWDTNNPMHKNKLKVRDSWTRMSISLNISVPELKAKKNSLMATYRSHRRRKLASIRSGARNDDVYQPIWFAYRTMEEFLGPVYYNSPLVRDNVLLFHSEKQEVDQLPSEEEEPEGNDDQMDVSSQDEVQYCASTGSNVFYLSERRRQKRRKRANEMDDVYKKISQSLESLSNVMVSKSCEGDEDDDCDLYGKLLAKKLRNFSVYERHQLMHEIDGLILKNSISSNSRRPPVAQSLSQSLINAQSMEPVNSSDEQLSKYCPNQ